MPLAVDDAERKRRKKHADYLLRSGRPQYVRDIGPLVAHIKWLNGEGMSCLQIARAAGVADTTVQQALKGARRGVEIGGVYRAQYEAILGVRPGPPPASGGARLCPVGTRRRLQALAAAGFPAPFLARELGWSRKEYVVKWTSDDVSRSFVTWAVRQAVFSTYRRLQLVDPVSVGLSRQQVTRSVNAARRNGWAPPGCWDPETIDDPLAWPEWTGRCGSVEGFRVHLRERIPVCARCWDGALVKRGSTSHRRR